MGTKKVPAGFNPCGCGCGDTTKSRFVPGHDSKLHSRVLRLARGEKLTGLSAGEVKAAKKAAKAGTGRKEVAAAA